MSERAVLVTGASRGIGAAVAAAFAAAGDRVALHYRGSTELAEKVRAALPGDGHLTVQGDLADPTAVASIIETVVKEFGRIDVLVNNAGIYVEHRIEDVSYDEWQESWQRTLAVNLLGPANLAWCAVRHMPRGGRIVNVSSRGAFRGEPRQPAYGASKAGLNSLGQSLARALGPRGIAVSTVAPGYVETDMAADVLAGPQGDTIRAQSPLGRVATPADVAAAVLYLASAQAELASGTIIDLNGASHLR
ncbi:SDR family NAD(P)-dependent oxidoreductase [Actinopolymorpha alba]|uniref:SDR family NAD(P)-dependent oxidoreductase n=1 Tax=Actinopolymorpha alba TaxID=533267 RepID=UPI0003777CA4|nr:SDR family oxidoreductase [Actinopolymorpha alba]